METYIKKNDWMGMILPHGWGNGYVIIPIGHKLHGVDYDDIDVDVHGGLTFSSVITEDDARAWGIDEKHIGSWMVGFDTCHYGDSLSRWPQEAVQAEADLLRLKLEALS